MRYAALLRGVNVGGHRKLPMARLRSLLTEQGLSGARTYIQSGNAVFEAGQRDAHDLKATIEGGISAEFGVDVSVILFSQHEMDEVAAQNPYRTEAEADGSKVHVMFLDELKALDDWSVVDRSKYLPDVFVATGRWLYMYLPNGIGRSKLPTVLERTSTDVAISTRNWRTVLKLSQMLHEAI